MGKKQWIWMVGAACILLAANTLWGQTVETTQSVERADSVFKLIMKGGIIMIPLALCSVLAVTLSLERFISLGRKGIIPPGLDPELDEVLENGKAGKIGKAREVLKNHASPMASIYLVGIDHWDRDAAEVDKAMGDTASLILRKMRRSIRSLRLISGISPLLGLLGTVLGMISAFQTVALSAQSINKAELLAEGIYQAMVTTAAGLVIAIPTVICYFYFSNRIDKLGEEIEEKGNTFLSKYFRSRLKLEN